MAKAIKIQKLEIVCDHCDFKEKVKVKKMKEYVDKACPKCSANLLTKDAYKTFKAARKAAKAINKQVGEVPEGSHRVSVRYKGENDGSIGSVKIK